MSKFFLTILFLLIQILSFAQIYDAEFINQETNIVISNNNKLTSEVFYEIKINNRAGEKFTKITIPFSKNYKVSNLKAHIKDSNGKLVKELRKNEVIERSSISDFSLYEDDFVKEFTLKHNSYPYTLVYTFQIQQNEFLYIDFWTPIIDESVPTINAKLKVTVPLNYKINYVNQFIDNPIIDTLVDLINYSWQTSYTSIIKPEVFSPPISNLLPTVAIVPNEFFYELHGSFINWITYGDWQYNLIHGLNDLPETEKSKIIALTKNIKEEKEKIKAVYHYLQDETRYINITIGTGGLKPYAASYVAQNKYGDCKALTNYFKSILDYLEIKSFYTKVYAGNTNKLIDKKFPSQQFNHIILYIPSPKKDIWLDCTSDGPFDYLGTFTQNRDAFIIDSNQSHFLKTPALLPNDVLETRRITIEYTSNKAIASFENAYKGEMFENIMQIEANYNESEKSRIFRNYIVENGFDLINYQILKPNRDSVKIDLIYKAESQQIYKHYGNDILISNVKFALPQFEKPKDRKLPIQIDYPIYKIDTLIYNIPIGYKLNKGFENYTDSNRFGQIKFNIFENSGKIFVIKILLINSGIYPVSDYVDFYRFYEKIIGIENKKQLSLNK